MTMNPGRSALRSFYLQVKAESPTLAVLISSDIINIALFEDDVDKTPVQDSVDHLRQMTNSLPENTRMVREDALESLGYS